MIWGYHYFRNHSISSSHHGLPLFPKNSGYRIIFPPLEQPKNRLLLVVPISGSQGTDLNNLNHQSFLAHSPVTRSLLSRVTASQMTSPYGPVPPRRWWQLSAMDFLHEFFYGVKFTIQKRRGILHDYVRVNRSVVFQWSKDNQNLDTPADMLHGPFLKPLRASQYFAKYTGTRSRGSGEKGPLRKRPATSCLSEKKVGHPVVN